MEEGVGWNAITVSTPTLVILIPPTCILEPPLSTLPGNHWAAQLYTENPEKHWNKKWCKANHSPAVSLWELPWGETTTLSSLFSHFPRVSASTTLPGIVVTLWEDKPVYQFILHSFLSMPSGLVVRTPTDATTSSVHLINPSKILNTSTLSPGAHSFTDFK